MLSNLQSIFGGFVCLKLKAEQLFGGFSIRRQLKIAVSGRGVTNKRKCFVSDERTAIGRVRVLYVDPVDDVRGYNTHYIDEDGHLSPDLMATKLSKVGGMTRNMTAEVQAYAAEFIRNDSQIALLVSMISTYFVLTYKESKTPLTLRTYDDGHIKMDLINEISDEPVHKEWYKSRFITHDAWMQTSFTDGPKVPVLAVQDFSERDLRIILAHLSGRQRTTRLAFDLDMPPLTDRVALAGHSNRVTWGGMDQLTSREIHITLDKYVMHNRLEGAFEAALAMYHQVAFTPLPDCAEGYVWLQRGRTLRLPKFDAFRGFHNNLLGEMPLGLDSSVRETWKWWRDTGLATAIAGSALNALSLWGRYLAEAKFYRDDSNIGQLGDLQFRENPAAAYYCYAALIAGKDVYCPLPGDTGLTFDPWDDDTMFKLPVAVVDAEARGYEIITETIEVQTGNQPPVQRQFIRVAELPPPCSAVNVIGRMPRSTAFSALSDRFSVQVDRHEEGWTVKNVNDAWAAGMIARWCGFDMGFEYRGRKTATNWAPNNSSIATRPFSVRGPDTLNVLITNIDSRKKTFMPLPPIDGDSNIWEAEIAVGDSVSLWTNDDKPVSVVGTLTPASAHPRIELPPMSRLGYLPVTVTAINSVDVQQAGFQIAARLTASQPAAMKAGPSAIDDETTTALGALDEPPGAD